jgi:hypothetical protein
MFPERCYKVSTSKRRKRGASSSGEGSAHDESCMPSQSEAESSYASGFHDIEMENVDMEFDPQVYQGPFKKWADDSSKGSHGLCL